MPCQHSKQFNNCYCFDLDGTLTIQPDKNSEGIMPIKERIEYVNNLFYMNHHITIFTARHDKKREKTKRLLISIGLEYHDLICSKPIFDFYICDRAVNDIDFFGPIEKGK